MSNDGIDTQHSVQSSQSPELTFEEVGDIQTWLFQ